MNTEIPGIRRNIFKSKKTVRLIAIGLVIILAAAAVITFMNLRKNKSAASSQLKTAVVTKGSLNVSITGSAPVQSADRRELSPKVTSKVNKVYFKEGDDVKEGDLLFELDDTDAQLNVENTRNSIAQTQLSQSSTQKSVEGLNVRAPFSGQATNILVKSGDTVGKGAAILTLVDTSKLKAILPFSGAGIKSVKTGQKATVNLQDLMLSVEGTVTYVSSKPYATNSGGMIYNVEISVDNPGSLTDGLNANAEITTSEGTLSSIESGTLAYINTSVLRSDAGGTVKSIRTTDKQYVNSGDLLLELENDDLKLTLDTSDLKMQNLQRQLEIQQEQLSYYKITAPVSGTITSQSVKEGDTVKQGDVLGVVSDTGHMQFSVTIDELDIAKVQVGQKVNITLDALPETTATPLTGVVTKTAMEGTSSNGVTTYPVTISIDKSDKLKAGMYANAEIFISQKDNVLMVPIEAVQKAGDRSFVMVKGNGQNAGSNGAQQRNANGSNTKRNRSNSSGTSDGSNAQASAGQQGAVNGNQQSGNAGQGANTSGNFQRKLAASNPYYANAVMRPVETGINNDTFIEITSGLQEGETVILPQTTASSGQSGTAQQNGKGGGMGIMGGLGGGAVRTQQAGGYSRGD